MFGLSEINFAPSPGEIALETSKGNQIGNWQGAKVAFGRIEAFRDMCRHRPHWHFRCDSHGLYNCAGLVWASRRTGISENSEWKKVLRDDGYRQISEPHLDDLVLYRDTADLICLHVGRVIAIVPGISEASPIIPVVLSKWGHDLGESVHFAHDHAIDSSYNVSIEYWTERQNDEPISQPTRIAY
jgi:hypothetical protein